MEQVVTRARGTKRSQILVAKRFTRNLSGNSVVQKQKGNLNEKSERSLRFRFVCLTWADTKRKMESENLYLFFQKANPIFLCDNAYAPQITFFIYTKIQGGFKCAAHRARIPMRQNNLYSNTAVIRTHTLHFADSYHLCIFTEKIRRFDARWNSKGGKM